MKKLDFNRGWTVRKDGENEARRVDLPHDAMLFERREKNSPAAGACGYFFGGKYFYEKKFAVPEEWRGGHILLECEGVYQNASVEVNGAKIAEHPYGYSNFYADLSDHLRYGEENTVLITADNANTPNSRWYSGSGIYREVHLFCAGDEYIAPDGLQIDNVSGNEIRVTVEGKISPATHVEVEILDGDGRIAIASGTPCTITVDDPVLWDAEHPCLYTCRVSLKSNGITLDTAETKFGMRTVKWNAGGLWINGKNVLLRGACIHHDNGVLGACAFRDAEYRRVRILKEAGFNAIRSAHNPASKALLDACDELGMYVMDETFDMWFIQKNPYDYGGDTFRKWWAEDTAAMIAKDRSHPSVILYSIGNEISDLGTPEGQEMCSTLTDFVHARDPYRPVTLGINLMLAAMAAKGSGLYGKDKSGKDKETGSMSMDSAPTSSLFNMLMNRMGAVMDRMSATGGADKIVEAVSGRLDIPGYNYATSRYKKEVKKYPSRAFIGSETLPKSLYKNWQLVKSLPNLIGDFMWTGWDYLGESGLGTIRYKDRKTKEDVEEGLIISGGPGIIDICGKMRPEVGWGKAIWDLSDRPVIGVDPLTHCGHFPAASMWRDTDTVESWSWFGHAGDRTTVTVYSNACEIRLFINGKPAGRQPVKDCRAVFRNIPYVPGKIEAAALDAEGKEISRSMLKTARGRTVITLRPEKTALRANGQDLCFLQIDLTGTDGVTRSSSDQLLTVTVEGAGTLQGFGSARPNMAENFVSASHTAFYGKALAVIRAGYEAGEIHVTVSGEGLDDVQMTLRVS